MTYDQWTWVATCTNTQFGKDDADLTDKILATTLTNKTPKCTAVGQVLTIPIDQDFTTTDWTTFKMKFKISVKMPSNLIGEAISVSGTMSDPGSNNVYATSNSITDLL